MICETCGGENVVSTICKAKPTEVPLRCLACGDPTEVAAWQGEKYGFEGQQYVPVCIADKDGFRQVDHDATIKAGPVKPPTNIRHLHNVCQDCGDETITMLSEIKAARMSMRAQQIREV